MTKQEKIKNIIAFLTILFGEDSQVYKKIMDFSPNYIIEKYDRYVLSQTPEFELGMHRVLKTEVFDYYCEKWHI